jgi:aspartate/glutamate racemase
MSSSFGKSIEFDKPRRLEEETAIYLSQLESQLEEIDKDDESVEILVSNVLEEIKQRTASAASDRRTNYIIEKLCYASNISQLLEIMKRCTPYSLFLVQNRYSSHIIQVATNHDH